MKTKSQLRGAARRPKLIPNSYNPKRDRVAVVTDVNSPDRDIASLRQARRNPGELKVDFDKWHWMLPCNRTKIAREQAAAKENRFDYVNNAEERTELANMLMASLDDKEVSRDLAAYRTFELTSDILALPFALGAFQSINLSADELPQIITPAARKYFTVRYMGQDGGARHDQWRTAREASEIEMRLISTDKIEYSLMDLQIGDISQYSAINDALRFDMEFKVDELARAQMDSNIITSGLRDVLNVHPAIDLNAIPDKNYLDLTNTNDYGTAHVWTIARLKAVLNHMAMWGFGLDPAGPVNIQTMIMSPLNARDSWDYIDLISDTGDPLETVTTTQREEILGNGSLLNSAWGYNWMTQYNHRVTKGRLYVLTNQPIGWFFTKTDWDRTIEWKDGPDQIEQNYGQILMRRALQFYMPDLWAYRYLVVDF